MALSAWEARRKLEEALYYHYLGYPEYAYEVLTEICLELDTIPKLPERKEVRNEPEAIAKEYPNVVES